MRVVITGADGFLGWHLACRLRSTRGIEPIRIGRADYEGSALLDAVRSADIVYHLAGVNRAASDDAVESHNIGIAAALSTAITESRRPVHVVYANSVQAELDNSYGRGKRRAAELLRVGLERVGGTMSDIVLPNLFGEHGRPQYNSFMATFCDDLVRGRTPTVTADREIPLLHAQRAAEELIAAAEARTDGEVRPIGVGRRVSEVLDQLKTVHALYKTGEIPDLSDPFAIDLFNTYRSYCFPGQFPMATTPHDDPRGRLFEAVRAHGRTGQAFVSTTVPGAIRGDHYHLNKIERFLVVSGEAEISLRRLYSKQVLRYRLSGAQPAFVDMPTMWVHNIRNIGDDDLVTLFWADQLLNVNAPDQYAEKVDQAEGVAR